MASKLKNHEKIHIYETPHTCSMPNCGLIFKTEAECKQHEESHNQRFKCEICGKQLASEKVNIQVPKTYSLNNYNVIFDWIIFGAIAALHNHERFMLQCNSYTKMDHD